MDAQSQNNFYFIYNFEEGLSFLEKNNKKYLECDFQVQGNNGMVYILPSGEYLFQPMPGVNWPNEGKVANIVFKNKSCFDEAYENENWPIKNYPESLYENYQNEILDINNNNLDFITKIIKKEKNLKFDDLLLLNKLRQELKNSKAIEDFPITSYYKKSGKRKIELYFCYYLKFLEQFLKDDNYQWVLIKKYGIYNSYFYPTLKRKSDNKILMDFENFLKKYINYNWDINRMISESDFCFRDPTFLITVDGFIYSVDFEERKKLLLKYDNRALN